MGIRKTTFQVVPLAEIAPLLPGAEVLGEVNEAETQAAPKRARILSVTYDQSLAVTRELLFASVGLRVSSVLTVDQAIRLCETEQFDLVVIGHSIPVSDRRSLLEELRRRCATPILALQRQGEQPLAGANYSFDSTLNPALLLEKVTKILKLKARHESGWPA
jgi:CheY-like chemotaxis protein